MIHTSKGNYQLGSHLITFAHQRQQEQEDVDNVNVQLKGTIDVLLWGQLNLPSTHDHLCVIDQELKQIQ